MLSMILEAWTPGHVMSFKGAPPVAGWLFEGKVVAEFNRITIVTLAETQRALFGPLHLQAGCLGARWWPSSTASMGWNWSAGRTSWCRCGANCQGFCGNESCVKGLGMQLGLQCSDGMCARRTSRCKGVPWVWGALAVWRVSGSQQACHTVGLGLRHASFPDLGLLHLCLQEGLKYMFTERSLVTVWSAPNYCYRCGAGWAAECKGTWGHRP